MTIVSIIIVSFNAREDLERCLESEGQTLANLVAVVVYATDMPALMATADIFAKRFGDAPPSSTWLGTTALAHPDQLVEITATAVDVNGY